MQPEPIDIFTDNTNYSVTKIFAWVNSDLDGVGSTILLGNLFPNFEYKSIFFGDFESTFTEWWAINQDNYDKVFIVGMPLIQSMVNKLDDYKIIFVSDNDRPNVFDSTLIYEDTTSCTKLLYKKFKDKIDFPLQLKMFFVYINDYNSYELKHEESKFINAIFRKSGGGKFAKFVNRFWKGFDGFSTQEINLAESFFKELDNELEGLDLFKGEFKGFSVISTFSKFSVNELSSSILDNYETDVVIVVNPDTQFISFRKSKTSKADIVFMAENLCNGGGGEWAAGGQITPKFLDFTQKLIQL